MSRATAPRTLFVAEPPASYLARAPVVVDCSVLAAWAFAEAEAQAAAAMLQGKALHAPSLLVQEMVNVAVNKVRRGLPEGEAGRVLAEFLEQDIELHDPTPDGQFALACRYALSGYDAAYLWLAATRRLPLLTFDRRLADVATRHLQSL